MSYDFGSQHAQGSPNFPPNYTTGSEELSYATDIIRDPAETDGTDDPASGWKRGLGIGSPQA